MTQTIVPASLSSTQPLTSAPTEAMNTSRPVTPKLSGIPMTSPSMTTEQLGILQTSPPTTPNPIDKVQSLQSTPKIVETETTIKVVHNITMRTPIVFYHLHSLLYFLNQSAVLILWIDIILYPDYI